MLAAKAATTTISIGFLSGLDPVKSRFVRSLSLPGGNVTGVSLIASALGAKRLEILRELVPTAVKIALLVNPSSQNTKTQLADIKASAQSGERQFHILNASSEGQIDAAFATLAAQRPDALLVGADPVLTSRRDEIVALANKVHFGQVQFRGVSEPYMTIAMAGACIGVGDRPFHTPLSTRPHSRAQLTCVRLETSANTGLSD